MCSCPAHATMQRIVAQSQTRLDSRAANMKTAFICTHFVATDQLLRIVDYALVVVVDMNRSLIRCISPSIANYISHNSKPRPVSSLLKRVPRYPPCRYWVCSASDNPLCARAIDASSPAPTDITLIRTNMSAFRLVAKYAALQLSR